MTEVYAGDPQAVVQLVAEKDVRKVQAVIEVRYGFRPTLAYTADLIAFVDSLTRQEPDHEPGE